MQTYSKIFLALLTMACLSGFIQVQQEEEKAIRNTVQAYQKAYNEKDSAKLSSLFASDASYFNPVTGDSAEGREAIEKLFRDKFAEGNNRRLEVEIKSIEFLSADEALENGVMKITLADQPAKQFAYQLGYVKENGKWQINSINEIQLQEAPSNFEQLKDLAWLIGRWADTDENIEILFDNRWDKNKNFIIQDFIMKIYGQDDIEGKQLIAWDPVKEVIRSWIFDSDGGFGEGTWKKEDKSWYATMNFTLGEGGVASSINVYTPIDDHSYTFASEEREVDGEILPDIDPVTVEKIK